MIVFISHQNNLYDNQVVGMVCQEIEDLNHTVRVHNVYDKIEYFVDIESLRMGDQLDATIEDGLQRADAFIVLLSPLALQSTWVHHEVNRFKELHPTAPILPIITQTCFMNEDPHGILEQLMGKGHEHVAIIGERTPESYLAAPKDEMENRVHQGMCNFVGFTLIWRNPHLQSDPLLGIEESKGQVEFLNTNWHGETLK